ncbi:MAG: DUF4445 domain-containing protein [Gammaproteobacteria bacterium]|nr:DUF4445 domain-containing protein [Gammaproteobacteria bacterium]
MGTSNDIGATTAAVVFTPSGKRGRFPLGTRILDAARALGVDIDSVCGGRGICGRCQVLSPVGNFSKFNIVSAESHLSASGKAEARYEKINGPLKDGRRLGCQAELLGDVVIDVPEDSQVHRQVVRKAADHITINLNPAVRLYYVEVREPDMHDPSGDLRRLKSALASEWQLEQLDMDFDLVHTLQKTLRAGDWKITAAVHNNQTIVGLWPGFHDEVRGVAIDVGSTTIAAHLCNLSDGRVLASSGAMNPQIRFGEDLMSRVSYVMMNPGGDLEMSQAVREAINQLLLDVTAQAGGSVEDILELTFVANPVMHHLLLGIDPVELGGAPFALAVDEALKLRCTELDLVAHPNSRAYFLPCIAGHVGADTAGVMLAEQPHELDELTLLVDVGTNAEIVLGNRERMVACSSPTGPAFEGAQISGGQRAAPGAIERVRIDRDTLEPRFSVIGSDVWSDDPAFTEVSNSIGITGICGSGIIEVIAEMFLAGIIDQDGVIQGVLAERSSRIIADDRTYCYLLHDGNITIRITQNDVRQIQLAKAALYAGVRLLMDRLSVDTIDRIRLAGAFGSHIDVKYAMVLGLIPDCNLEQVASAGNAAGTGALIALMNAQSREEIEALVQRVEKIETAVEPRFQEHFVEAMAFPHKTAQFPELSRVVELPEPQIKSADKDSVRRGRNARRRARKSG